MLIVTCLIAISTVLIKQHSVIDVILAIILNLFCYFVCYVWIEKYKDKLSLLCNKREICSIPNLLSVLRFVIAIVILAAHVRWKIELHSLEMILLLLVSAFTDFLDGWIARKYHMITEVGKIIDPIADKVTQGVLLLCFIREYPITRWLFLIFVVKELIMGIAGIKT
ncbi:MAG: CDP-alcohol phosphatidyltransferase family protein, partial [Lachnospiraceae bacterium]|nr:CDP-alcohol phosphatidyltransferase family protein [Lachnospiraceae bacterium]